MTDPGLFLLVAAGYALAGIVFAPGFVTFGVAKLDPAVRGTSWTFRALILPGSAVLWPLLAVKWARHKGEAA